MFKMRENWVSVHTPSTAMSHMSSVYVLIVKSIMEVSNLFAFSNLIGKLFECLGNTRLSQEDLLNHIIRSQRKHKGCGDLFLPFIRQDQENVRLCIDGNIVINISHAKADLPGASQNWPIPISTCSFTDNGWILNLNRIEAFKTVIWNVISERENYGKFHRNCQEYTSIRYNEHSEDLLLDLSETRVAMAGKVVGSLLQAAGYKIEVNPKGVDKNQSMKEFYFTHKSTDDGKPVGSTCVTCGAVLNAETGCKENNVTATDYYRLWEDIISKVSQERDNGEPKEVQSEINANIAQAAVLFDLLAVKLNSSISLKLPTLDKSQCYGVSSKGAPFVLYNTARLASIISQFTRKVEKGEYPQLPAFDKVDMSVLNCDKEWSLLLHFIMIYPHVMIESLTGLNEGKPNLHNFVAFINAFCKEISVYYRRVRILTEPRSQLLPIMFARIYLLQAVQQVLRNALNILSIKPLLHM